MGHDFHFLANYQDKCLELLKRTEGIRKCLYEILESIGTQERSENAKESSMLGDEPEIPGVSIELQPSQEQQQEPTVIKQGKQANFEVEMRQLFL